MRWKMIAGGAVGLLVLLIATLYLILATYDYNRLKPEIVRAVTDATGRELTLGGDIKLDIGLAPALVVTEVKFANTAWGSQPLMLKADRLQARLRLLPLLRRDVELERIALVGLDLFLETDAVGRGNWDFEGAAGRGKSLPVDMHVDVTNVSIENLNFAFRDGKTGSTTRFTLAGLDAVKNPSADGLTVDIKGTVNGQPAEISGKIGLLRNLGGGEPFPLDLTGEVSGAKLNLAGSIGDPRNLREIDLNVHASGANLAGVGGALAIGLPATDAFTVAGRLKGSPERLTLEDAAGNLSRGSVTLNVQGNVGDVVSLTDMRLDLTGSGNDLAELGRIIDVALPQTGPFTVKGRLTGSAKALSLTEAQGSASRESLKVRAHGKIKDLLAFSGMDLEVTASGKDLAELARIIDVRLPRTGPFAVKGRLTGSTKALSLTEAQGSVSRESLRVSATGKVKDLLSFSGMDLKVTAAGREFADIGTLITTKLPELGSFDLSGRLTGSPKSLGLEGLYAVLGKSDFRGSAKVEFRQRPRVTLVLESGLVDFTPLMRKAREEDKLVEKEGRDRRLFADDPLPVDLLKKVDADLTLSARRIQARDAGLEFGRLTLMLNGSELSIDTLEAVYEGAQISGDAHFYPGSPPTIITKFLVQNFDLGGFLRETGASDQVEGHIDIAADLKSAGESVHSLMANLNGTAGAVMGKGYFSKYLDLIAMDLSRKVIPFWGSNKEAGRVKCGVVEFDIKNGLATSQAFAFDTKLTILTGEGEINLDTEQLNFLLAPKPKDPSLFSLATKLRVGGTIQDPTVRPDMVSLVTKGVEFLSAFAIGPAGLLVPFVNLGAHQKHPCEIGSMGK